MVKPDDYIFPNKWIGEDFVKIQILCEECKKERAEKKAAEACQQFESKKGN